MYIPLKAAVLQQLCDQNSLCCTTFFLIISAYIFTCIGTGYDNLWCVFSYFVQLLLLYLFPIFLLSTNCLLL